MHGLFVTACGLCIISTARAWQAGQPSHDQSWLFSKLRVGVLVGMHTVVCMYLMGTIIVISWVLTNASYLSVKLDMVMTSLRDHNRNHVEFGITKEVIWRTRGNKILMDALNNASTSGATSSIDHDKLDSEIKAEPYYAKLTHGDDECVSFDPKLMQISIKDWPRALRIIPQFSSLVMGTGYEEIVMGTGSEEIEFVYSDLHQLGLTEKLSMLIPNTKLGDRLAANLTVQHFVDLASLVALAMNSWLLYHSLGKTSRYIGAIVGFQMGIIIFSKCCYSIILTAFTQAVVANAVDGLAQRNGICYRKSYVSDIKAPNMVKLSSFASFPTSPLSTVSSKSVPPVTTSDSTAADQTMASGAAPVPEWAPVESMQRHSPWMTIVWDTKSRDPRRRFWCKSEGIGVHYSVAVDSAEEACQLTDDATKLATSLCIVYITGTLATIAVYQAGYSVLAKSPVIVLGFVVALASAMLSYSCLSLTRLASAAVHARRSRSTLTSINEGVTLSSKSMIRRYMLGAVFDKHNNIVVGRSILGRLGYMCRFLCIPLHLYLDRHRYVNCKVVIRDGAHRGS